MLVLVAAVTLAVGGVGIMNIMLATVRSRIREIGIRKALGATYREIKLQFLAEAVIISLAGGVVGVLVGLTVPLSIRLLHQLCAAHLRHVRADCAGRSHHCGSHLRNRAGHARRPDGSGRVAQV